MTSVAKKHKTIFHLEDIKTSPTPDNISYMLEEFDPREKATKRRGGPIEELESIKLDD